MKRGHIVCIGDPACENRRFPAKPIGARGNRQAAEENPLAEP